MEVSVVNQPAARSEVLFPVRNRISTSRPTVRTRLSFSMPNSSPVFGRRKFVRVPAIRAVAVRSQMTGVEAEEKTFADRGKSVLRGPSFFVGLPLDTVSDCNTVNHAKAISAGLKVLKLLGVDGVEVPFWWGVVEKEAMGEYDWSGYLKLAEMIRDNGLQIRVSLCFHASKVPQIPLPSWVSCIGDTNSDIYFADKEGKRHKECLSLAVDELPVLSGKSPIEVYDDFFRSFLSTFSEFMGSTITDISIGLGPAGELRYPSLPSSRNNQVSGVGEFQCYDKNMLNQLKQHAEKSGNHLWGLSGPHDAPRYDQTPDSGNFFKEHGGSWDTPYGDFFLDWYSNQLLSHCDRVLSKASAVFADCPVTLSGRIPLMHSWYKTRSHPSELTAGYYNTDRREGYKAVVEMFAKNSCGIVLTGMELSDERQPQASRSSPESLISQITTACKQYGVRVIGENSSIKEATNGFGKIREKILDGKLVDTFTYQRMGVQFFSPEHWPQFMAFIRSFSGIVLHPDDLVTGEEDSEDNTTSLRKTTMTEDTRQMQSA